jgi:branched-chain amino acid transport system permease protein
VLKAIREDEQVAESLGKDTRVFKLKVFVIGCALMGLGGILWEGSKGFTSPTTTTVLPLQTFFICIALSIGGAGSNTGSVLGGALFAGLLFQGPLTVMQILGSALNLDGTQVAPNFADALGGRSSRWISPGLSLSPWRSALRSALSSSGQYSSC